MARELSVKDWQEEIRSGQRFQTQFGESNKWSQYKKYYRHQFDKNTLPVNLVFSIMRSMVAQTYYRIPSVTVTPTKPGLIYTLHAKLVETIDRWLLRELGTKYEIKKMIQDAFICGIASGFNGYDSEFGWSPKRSEEGVPATLTQFDRKGYRIEYNSYVNPGMPWFLRARPDDVIWPWGTTDKNNAPWVALRILRPLEDIKADRKYKVPTDLSGSHVPYRTGPNGAVKQDYFADVIKGVNDWVELWQIHDARTGKIYAITMNTDDYLRKDIDYMQIDGLPVETLVFNPDPDYIYGVSDAKIIEPQLLELNEIRNQAMKHRRVDLLKVLYKKGALNKAAVEKLLDEDVKAAVEVNVDSSIRDAVMPVSSAIGGILQDMALSAETVRQDIREMVGFSRVNLGEFQGKTHVSASEVNSVMKRGDIRMDERRDAVADLLENIVRKFNQTIFTYWTLPQVRDIVGPDGARYWIQFTGPEIKGEYNIRVDPTSSAPIDPDSKKRDAIEMAKAWAEMNAGRVQQGMPIPKEIQRYFFSQYEGLDIESLLRETGAETQQMPQVPMSVNDVARSVMSNRRGGV